MFKVGGLLSRKCHTEGMRALACVGMRGCRASRWLM